MISNSHPSYLHVPAWLQTVCALYSVGAIPVDGMLATQFTQVWVNSGRMSWSSSKGRVSLTSSTHLRASGRSRSTTTRPHRASTQDCFSGHSCPQGLSQCRKFNSQSFILDLLGHLCIRPGSCSQTPKCASSSSGIARASLSSTPFCLSFRTGHISDDPRAPLHSEVRTTQPAAICTHVSVSTKANPITWMLWSSPSGAKPWTDNEPCPAGIWIQAHLQKTRRCTSPLQDPSSQSNWPCTPASSFGSGVPARQPCLPALGLTPWPLDCRVSGVHSPCMPSLHDSIVLPMPATPSLIGDLSIPFPWRHPFPYGTCQSGLAWSLECFPQHRFYCKVIVLGKASSTVPETPFFSLPDWELSKDLLDHLCSTWLVGKQKVIHMGAQHGIQFTVLILMVVQGRHHLWRLHASCLHFWIHAQVKTSTCNQLNHRWEPCRANTLLQARPGHQVHRSVAA